METLSKILSEISGFLWGIPLMVALLGTGIYLTFKSKGIQFRGFLHGLSLISGKYDKKEDKGERHIFKLSQPLCQQQ